MNFKLMRLIERLNLNWHINVIVKHEVISTLTEQNIRNSLSWHGDIFVGVPCQIYILCFLQIYKTI
jgi:hypothetical protein